MEKYKPAKALEFRSLQFPHYPSAWESLYWFSLPRPTTFSLSRGLSPLPIWYVCVMGVVVMMMCYSSLPLRKPTLNSIVDRQPPDDTPDHTCCRLLSVIFTKYGRGPRAVPLLPNVGYFLEQLLSDSPLAWLRLSQNYTAAWGFSYPILLFSFHRCQTCIAVWKLSLPCFLLLLIGSSLQNSLVDLMLSWFLSNDVN